MLMRKILFDNEHVCGSNMPDFSSGMHPPTKFSLAEANVIRGWICAGAPNN